MSNNKNIKIMFDEEFNIEKMKEKIIREERKNSMNSKVALKWSLIPICIVAIITTIFFINENKELKPNIYQPNIDNVDNANININDISKITQGALKLDVDIKTTSKDVSVKNGRFEVIEELEDYPFYKDLNVSSEYNAFVVYGIFVDNDKKGEYNSLNNYVLSYKVKDQEKEFKEIKISFSKDNKPIRDYFYEEKGSKTSTINGNELKIFKCNETFFTEFIYDGINFDIETHNVSEQELIDLLVSIIK